MKWRALLAAALSLLGLSTANAGLLYSIRESDNFLVSIDTTSLAYTVIGATGVSGNFGGMAYDPVSDKLYWIPGRGVNNLYTLNRTTGAATLVGSHGINDLFGLEFDTSTGTLYATQFAGGSGFYHLNTATGAATTINPAMTHQIGGLAYDSTRDQLVGVEDGAGDLYVINRANGAQSLLFNGPSNNDSGLAYAADTDLFWDIDWNGNLYRYDIASGYARTTVLSGLTAHDGLAYVGPVQNGNVPEPSSLALLGLSAAGLVASRRKNSQRA